MTGHTSRRQFLAGIGLATAGLCAPGGRARAQQPGAGVFRTDIELVSTPVTVTDEEGRLVSTLDREDFEVFEDGIVQPIAQFTKERLPVSVALVLDVSDSMVGARMDDARTALERFLDDLLAPEDEASLVLFNHAARVASTWTLDRAPLQHRLVDVQPSGGTALYDAVTATLPLFRTRRHARAAMLLVSDGADTASDISLMELRTRLTGSDVFVYAIAIEASNGRRSTQVNPWALRDVTGSGGGYTEVIAQSAQLGPATERIAYELNHQYMLGFSPDRRADGRYHTIRITVPGRNYRVRSRRGYFAGPRRS